MRLISAGKFLTQHFLNTVMTQYYIKVTEWIKPAESPFVVVYHRKLHPNIHTHTYTLRMKLFTHAATSTFQLNLGQPVDS